MKTFFRKKRQAGIKKNIARPVREVEGEEKRDKGATAQGGRVTALEAQAKRPNRFNLYLDDRFCMGLSAMVALTVRVGQELTAEDVARLAAEEDFERAREKALRILEVRPRSEQEVRARLARRYTPQTIERVITRLREAGLLSDPQFAEYWVENREGFKPRSARALKYELRQKGVPGEAITKALENLDEPASAYRAARTKAERFRALDRKEFETKVGGFLMRRGFNYSVTREVVRKLYQEVHSDEPVEGDLGEA